MQTCHFPLRRNSYDNLYVTVILILLDVSIFGSPDPMCTNIKPPHLLARRQKIGVSFFQEQHASSGRISKYRNYPQKGIASLTAEVEPPVSVPTRS
jgi:hypothetical protein